MTDATGTRVSDELQKTAELVAQVFHDSYERRAPDFGYRTRAASAVPWDRVPENNRKLMVAVALDVLEFLGV